MFTGADGEALQDTFWDMGHSDNTISRPAPCIDCKHARMPQWLD